VVEGEPARGLALVPDPLARGALGFTLVVEDTGSASAVGSELAVLAPDPAADDARAGADGAAVIGKGEGVRSQLPRRRGSALALGEGQLNWRSLDRKVAE
jgi:hypothetical protein